MIEKKQILRLSYARLSIVNKINKEATDRYFANQFPDINTQFLEWMNPCNIVKDIFLSH